MSQITEQFDASDAEQVMRRVSESFYGSYQPVLEDCVPIATEGVRANFNSSVTPDGENWVARKIPGDGHPLLMESGALLQAATGGGAGHIREISENELAMGVSVGVIAYAAAQNYGYPERNLPAREYMGLQEPYLLRCENEIANFVVTAVF